MALKEEIKPHIVIPDTNILWFKDKTIVVNPDFNSFWDKYSQDSNLQLVIPEIVKGEILFQQSTSAIKKMEKAVECITEVCAITECKHSHSMTAKKIRTQIEKRFNKWAKQKYAIIENSPISAIAWRELIHNSIWRKPPFELDAKNSENEKGFRDAIILETIIEYTKRDKSDCFIAFICNDNLLRDTAGKKLKLEERFSVYKSTEDFESYLKLQHEELSNKFIKSILRKASLKFFNPKDKNCLNSRENLIEKIEEKFGQYIKDPKLSEANKTALGLSALSAKWNPSVGGKYWIANSHFEKIENLSTYYWNNDVTYAKKYVRAIEGLADVGLTDNERILILQFNITWTSKVSKDGRFRDLIVQEIKMKTNTFTELTPEFKRIFELE